MKTMMDLWKLLLTKKWTVDMYDATDYITDSTMSVSLEVEFEDDQEAIRSLLNGPDDEQGGWYEMDSFILSISNSEKIEDKDLQDSGLTLFFDTPHNLVSFMQRHRLNVKVENEDCVNGMILRAEGIASILFSIRESRERI